MQAAKRNNIFKPTRKKRNKEKEIREATEVKLICIYKAKYASNVARHKRKPPE